MNCLLSSAYFAPVQYFCAVASCGQVCIEAHEHYLKQTYRTRCEILGANGVLQLSVPVEKVHGEKMPIRDVRIDYSLPWQRTHWRSLVAAYSSSPFFMHYADDVEPVFRRREAFLFDLNMEITRLMCDLAGIRTEILLTDAYRRNVTDAVDLRQNISPKSAKHDSAFAAARYYQVFSKKFGFVPNLSILDLLFNEGPETVAILKRCTAENSARSVPDNKV